MDARKNKAQLKPDLKRVFQALDFVGKHLNGRRPPKATQQLYFNVYQVLGLAWEFLGLQCKHWDGYKRSRDGKQVCRICGKLKGVQERLFLLADSGMKRIGRRAAPTSKETFANKSKAQIVHDQMVFHGAFLDVDVHNSYKSSLFGKDHEITVAADRTVTLKESGIKCSVDEHVIDLKIEERPTTQKPPYGGFPWELSKEKLKHFPVIFRFDDNYRFLGLTIIRPVKKL
ncbi:MAG: hypothetical protein Q8S00_05790 [Deltaproteobacteria bacterium]|nr:hypothetical protein [Deltaproteobacteria bacterium]MDZ4347693.1 hypothetical protein [Candidatus Binatia bacterium]